MPNRGVAGVLIAAGLSLATPGCALLASANRAHSHISGDCVDEPMFGIVDLVIGLIVGGTIMASGYGEEHPAILILPGLLVAEGGLGVAFANSCAGEHSSSGTGQPGAKADMSDYNYDGTAPVREAPTDEKPIELPVVPPAPGVDLRVAPDYAIGSAAPPAEPVIKCSVEPKVPCPDHYFCALVDGSGGVCERLK